MCTSAASAGTATQRTPSASRLATTYDLNFIAIPFIGMSPQALGKLPRSGRAGIVTSRHGELSADVSDRPDGVTSERPLPGLHCNLPYVIICGVFTMRAQRVWSHPTAGAKI